MTLSFQCLRPFGPQTKKGIFSRFSNPLPLLIFVPILDTFFIKSYLSLSTDYTYKFLANDSKRSEFSPKHLQFTFQPSIKKFFIGDYAQILTGAVLTPTTPCGLTPTAPCGLSATCPCGLTPTHIASKLQPNLT
jgi:hypothetical protein